MRPSMLACLTSALLSLPLCAAELPPLKLDTNITLSGLSSGAYMAGQYHLAFAENVDGVAMIAAGPVYCAQNSLGLALEHCFNKDSTLIKDRGGASTLQPNKK